MHAPSPDSGREQSAQSSPGGLSRVVLRGVGLAGAGYGLSQLLSFVAYLVLAKLATPTDFGHFAAGTLVAGVGTVLGGSGMGAALIQRRERIEEAFNSAFVATLAGGVALSLLALACAPLIGLFFHSGETGAVAAAMSGWLLLRMVTIVPDARLQRDFSFLRRVIVDPIAVAAFGTFAIAFAAAGWGVWALVAGTYAGALVNVVTTWAFARWRPRLRLASVREWRELARFGRPIVGGELIRRVSMEIPVALIGRVSGPSALGQYSYASRVATQPLGAVINAGGYVLLPAFARLSAFDARFRAAFLRALRWLCALAFPVGLLLVPLGLPAMVLVFGEQWRDAGYAVMALSGYCAALTLDSIASEAWKAANRPAMLPRMHGLALVLTVAFSLAGAPFGLIGVSLGLSLGAIGVAAYAMWGVSDVLEIPGRRLVHEIWPPAVAAVAMAGLLTALELFVVKADEHGTAVGLLLVAALALLGMALYLGLLALLAPATTDELVRSARRYARSRGIGVARGTARQT